MSIDIEKITPFEMTTAKVDSLISCNSSFQVVGVVDISKIVSFIEGRMAKADRSCRVFTEYRKAAMAGSFFGPTAILGVASAVGIAAHNLATFNPDFEIGKNKLAGTVTVTFKK